MKNSRRTGKTARVGAENALAFTPMSGIFLRRNTKMEKPIQQEKTKSEILQDQINDLNKKLESLTTWTQRLKELEKPLLSTSALKSKELEQLEHSTPKHTETALEHLENCPNCKKQAKEKLKKEVLHDYTESLKGKPIAECLECGLEVDQNANECPSCSGTKAKPRE